MSLAKPFVDAKKPKAHPYWRALRHLEKLCLRDLKTVRIYLDELIEKRILDVTLEELE